MAALSTTPLNAFHHRLGARMVPYSGWEMPLHYGSQIQEHLRVRQGCGCFDVSHMATIDIEGAASRPFLQRLLANDVARLTQPGKALYSCLLNPQGGVIDDLIVYWLGGDRYRWISNAATRAKVTGWLAQQAAAFDVSLCERHDLAMIAIQGPSAGEHMKTLFSPQLYARIAALAPFSALDDAAAFIARTGYTGEDGFEVLLEASQAANFWKRLLAQGATPCGLAARDSLRLEAGMSLYGHEMDETILPDEAALGWTVALSPPDRAFIGRAPIEALRARGLEKTVKGLILDAKGVCRSGMSVVFSDGRQGTVTSGGYSPVLERGIALVRVPPDASDECALIVRDRPLPAQLVSLPFVRRGKACLADAPV